MTNLEFYKDEIKDVFVHDKYLCDSIRRVASRHGYDTKGFVSEGKVIDWLLEEHKEPIKLKQWEKDFIISCTESYAYEEKDRVINYWTLKSMIKKGYFKGITDTNMGIKEILGNCEVEDR